MTVDEEMADLVQRATAVHESVSIAVDDLDVTAVEVRDVYGKQLLVHVHLTGLLADRLRSESVTGCDDSDRAYMVTEMAMLELRTALVVAEFRSDDAKARLRDCGFGRVGETGDRMAEDAAVRLGRIRARVAGFLDRVVSFGGRTKVVWEGQIRGDIDDLDRAVEALDGGCFLPDRLSSGELDFMDLLVDAKVASAERQIANEMLEVHVWSVAVGAVTSPSDLGL